MSDAEKYSVLICPNCGEELFWDENALKPDAELPPKPWYGIDPYSDPAYLGAWTCWKCGYTQ